VLCEDQAPGEGLPLQLWRSTPCCRCADCVTCVWWRITQQDDVVAAKRCEHARNDSVIGAGTDITACGDEAGRACNVSHAHCMLESVECARAFDVTSSSLVRRLGESQFDTPARRCTSESIVAQTKGVGVLRCAMHAALHRAAIQFLGLKSSCTRGSCAHTDT
jgi:hypothetical protein